MYLFENPVLQRELLVNLRMKRAFVLLFVYVAMLGVVVFAAWPRDQRLDLTQSPEEARQLVNWFFLGQYVLMSLMVPSFAAGSITGEKERQTYEMLLASPMRPQAIVTGKLAAALCHLAVLVIASLPIVMLCLPLGRRVALRGDGHIPCHGDVGDHLRHDLPDGQQLFHPNLGRIGGFVPDHFADGYFRSDFLSTYFRRRAHFG